MCTIKKLSINKMQYYVCYPNDFDENKKYPLILFLHGAGERNKISESLIYGPIYEMKNGNDLQFIILQPFCKGNNTWFNYGETLIKLVEKYQKCEYVDNDRIYLTGLSMGGYGTWALAIAKPEYFAAISPLCGGGECFNIYTIKDVPTWAFHGDMDNVVPLSESSKMVDKLKECGGNVKFTILKGYGHNIWSYVYHQKELYDWFLSYKLGDR